MKHIKAEKKRCEICLAKNRNVKWVSFFGKSVMMCEKCAEVAKAMAEAGIITKAKINPILHLNSVQ